MSATAMQRTYPTQHCGCDFCSSRRSVNAKKLAVSQLAASRRGDCSCKCHSENKQHGKGCCAGFNPDFPEPVNQAALNASRGRNGTAGGNQYTIKNRTTRDGADGGLQGSVGEASGKETAEQRQAREAAELDALERLLIAEYKARTRAALERQRLQSASTNIGSRGPQPLPEDYNADGTQNSGGCGEPSTWGRSGLNDSDSQNASTIHQAYAMAQACPVTPPVQCHASHRLQDTMDDVRKVTGDPVNPTNRRALQHLLRMNGMDDEASSTQGENSNKNDGTVNAFGNSLAQIRTNNAHPRGAGVVWATAAPLQPPLQQSSMKDTNALAVEKGTSAGDAGVASSASAKRPPLATGAAAAGAAARQSASERHVAYAA